jgi:hypothetical protein
MLILNSMMQLILPFHVEVYLGTPVTPYPRLTHLVQRLRLVLAMPGFVMVKAG